MNNLPQAANPLEIGRQEADRARVGRRLRRWLGLGLALGGLLLVYLYLYTPLLVTALFSFNASSVQTLPLTGLTLDWYRDLFANEQMKAAFIFSLQVALTATFVSSVAAMGFAMIQVRMKFTGKRFLDLLLASPMVTPGMVLGISLLVVFRTGQIPTGFFTLVVGHCAFLTPLISFVVQQRLKTLDPSLEHASMDLGAGTLRTFWHVTLPGVRTSLVAGALLGFTLSMDEIAVSFFLAGTQPTLPVHVWSLVRFGFTPEVNAVFTLIGGASLTLIFTAAAVLWFGGRGNRQPRGTEGDDTAEYAAHPPQS